MVVGGAIVVNLSVCVISLNGGLLYNQHHDKFFCGDVFLSDQRRDELSSHREKQTEKPRDNRKKDEDTGELDQGEGKA